jgi:predicted amidohydrolase YtcJ
MRRKSGIAGLLLLGISMTNLVILSHDIFKIDPRQIDHTKVILTMIDGRVVYQAH